jgi:hypothetical protein
MKTRNRRNGYIVHLGLSRSAGYWAIIKDPDGRLHFGYGKSFLGPGIPKIGHEVEFTRLPPADRGEYDRATEIAIIKRRKGGQIQVGHDDGVTRLILRAGGSERVIGEIQI